MKKVLLTIPLILILFGCQKEEKQSINEISPSYPIVEEPFFSSEYDMKVNAFAKSISAAIRNNSNVRTLIMEEVKEMKDGDYDVLLTDISQKTTRVSDEKLQTKANNGFLTFSEIINSYYPGVKSTSEDILSQLESENPDLQIAVPVHAEDWDPETYVPVVAFIPEGYKEYVTETVPGYDAEGNYVEVDAINAPEVPVIVISKNERMERVTATIPDSGEAPQAPTNLVAIATNTNILLTWSHAGGAQFYRVYRKGPNQNNFSQVGVSNGANNKSYSDNDLSANITYQYYVRAFCVIYRDGKPQLAGSEPSNIVVETAPSVPSPLTSFSLIPTSRKLDIRWTRGNTPVSNVVLQQRGPSETTFSTIFTTSGFDSNYLYTPTQKGVRNDFRIFNRNNIGDSDALYDFIYPPYRNVSDLSRVYIKKMKYTDGSVEGWLQGAPEFYVKVFSTDGQSAQEKYLYFQFEGGHSVREYAFNSGNLAYTWPGITDFNKELYSAIVFEVYEDDGSAQDEEHSGSIPIKFKLGDYISLETAIPYSYKTRADDDYCGHYDLYYYVNSDDWLPMSYYGLEINISESNTYIEN